jgi:hypothetical protein
MKAQKVIELSQKVTVKLNEMTVKDGLVLLESIEQTGMGLDEFIFINTDKLIESVGDAIIVLNPDGIPLVDLNELTGSDFDDIATGFVQQNASFFSRAAKKKAIAQAAAAPLKSPPDLSTDPPLS